MATEAVYKYLYAQNRPYSTNDIVQNLHKEYGKTAIQKALDQLVEDKRILEKTYGKQKVYCVTQESDDGAIGKMNEEIQKLDANCEKISIDLKQTDDDLKKSETELKQLQNSLKTQEAIEKRDKMKEHIDQMQAKLKTLQSTQISISNEEKQQIIDDHTKYVKEYRKRKRICMEIIDSIMEGYPKSKKQLIEEIGMETDEEVNFKLNI